MDLNSIPLLNEPLTVARRFQLTGIEMADENSLYLEEDLVRSTSNWRRNVLLVLVADVDDGSERDPN